MDWYKGKNWAFQLAKWVWTNQERRKKVFTWWLGDGIHYSGWTGDFIFEKQKALKFEMKILIVKKENKIITVSTW